MVFVGIRHALVLAEALAPPVIVVIDFFPLPVAMALDAEVIVRLARQFAPPRAGFEQALCQRDARRDLVAMHVVDS